ncbi:MAG: DegT/DnrJ/EryC1/StrS family aminotransferase, partial [Candidatus Thermoplasmatota archaeon]|nr:DegT/DnrJ/EryC1/StrS family aminotransferase [Candidatus Thermoplasmatota archaeon]
QTMEGGMVLCKHKDDADYLRSMRAHGWVRDLPDNSSLYKKTGNAFNDNFIFATPGYNLRPLEMSGAIGSVQLRKWNDIMKVRLENTKHFLNLFANKSWCRIQKEIGESINALTNAGIQNRPLASRNFLKQPVMPNLDHIVSGTMDAANDIHDNGFFVGNGSIDIKEGIDKMYEIISGFAK